MPPPPAPPGSNSRALCTYDHFMVRRDNLFVILLFKLRKRTVKFFSEPQISLILSKHKVLGTDTGDRIKHLNEFCYS